MRNWIFINAWVREGWDLSPDQRTSSKNLSPSSREWTDKLDCGWTSSSVSSLSISTAFRNVKGLACSLIWHAFSKLRFLCYSQINSISGHFSLPQFTFLFRFTVFCFLEDEPNYYIYLFVFCWHVHKLIYTINFGHTFKACKFEVFT